MTELQLYKFVNNNKLEYHWANKTKKEVYLFVPFCLLSGFTSLFGNDYFDDGDFACVMKKDYVCFDMAEICQYYDIDIDEIFDKEY